MIDPASRTEGLRDIVIEGETISGIYEPGRDAASGLLSDENVRVIDAGGKVVAPGLVDPHVHFRDPGFTYKEDIETGARAAARGGFTSVIMMGNTKPHMDNAETIKDVLKRGAKPALTYIPAPMLPWTWQDVS